MLISLEFSNGGADPIVTVYKVQTVTDFPTGQVVTFSADLATASAVHSATNFVDLPDQGLGYAVPALQFAETSIDLGALGINTGCPGLSAGHIRTRAGGDIDSSQLKDALAPFPIDLNNCGKVTIIKDAIPDHAQNFAFTTTGTSLSDFTLDDDDDALFSNTKVFSQVVNGVKTVTETAVPGWKLTNIVCSEGAVDVVLGKATLDVGPNEEITCTFTNKKLGKIIVEKQTLPNGSTQSFTFDTDYGDNFNLTDDGTNDSGPLQPGNYSVAEINIPAGWDLASATCSDGSDPDSIDLAFNETVTCTFNNRQRGTITIVKDAIPDDPQDFAFTTTGAGLSPFSLDDDGNTGNDLSDTKVFSNVVPGAYSVTETNPLEWELTNLVCSGTSGSTGVQAGSTANINLTPGGSVSCTFTNTKAGHIIIDKVTDPSGDPQSFEFNPSWSATNFSLTDQATPKDSGELKFGVYSVVETVPAGWDLTSATCSDGSPVSAISLQPGEIVTCTFTNTKRAMVIVKKVMVGGTATFAFTGTPNGSIAVNNGTISQEVVAGQYVSTETALPGWDLTDVDCDDNDSTGSVANSNATFNVAAGETVTCTFTNTKQGKVIVKKVMVGGTGTFAFTGTPNGSIAVNNGTITADVTPGQYVSTETALPGWDLTDVDCDDNDSTGSVANSNATFNVAAGETVTCTFTNTKQGKVIVKKVMVGGTGTFAFTGTPNGSIAVNNGTITADVTPGQYVSTETALPGWDLTDVDCDDNDSTGSVANSNATFNVAAGETVTCTFTNTKQGKIIVQKVTSPADATDLFTFSGDASGSIADGGEIVVDNLVPGTYTSVEAVKEGWDLGAIVCTDSDPTGTTSSGVVGTRTATFKLDPGETVTCVFFNAQRGTITIIKDAQPNDAQDFHYDFTGLEGPVAFNLDDDGDATLPNMVTFENLIAGPYSVDEDPVAGWDLTDLDCTVTGGSTAQINGAMANLTLSDGGSITCVYVNSKPSISIVKTAGTALDGEEFVTGPGPVTYHYVVTNTGPIALINVVVTDDNGTPGSTADDFTADCPATILAAGASMECTATVSVTANRTNIGTATGELEAGTEVEDEDDAVVRIPVIDILKTADDHQVEPNQIVTYTILVEVANGPVHDAIVTDELPVGQTYVVDSASPSQPTVSPDGRTLTWNLGTLNDGDPAVTITYDVKIDAGAGTTPQTNVAKICVSELPTCEDEPETVTPELPDIEIIKTAGTAADGEVFSTEPGNVTYTYVVENTGPLPLEDVTVTDDNGTPGTSDDFAVTCPQTTLAVDESMTCTATVAVLADKVNVATARGFTAEGNPVEDEDDAEVVILTHGLVIAKSNNAPLEELELPDGSTADLPTADEGETVTFTLAYTFSGDPVTKGIITDVLPEGLTYVGDSATDSAEFIFEAYDPTTRTLTWKAEDVTASGEVTYQATVDEGAAELPQPLVNVATIDSDQTDPDDDTSEVFVPTIPAAETSVPTAPRTDILEAPSGSSGPGSGLLLMLLALGGLVLGVSFVTPVPERVRRRNRR